MAVLLAAFIATLVFAAPANAARWGVSCSPTYVWSGAGPWNTYRPGHYIVGALWPPQTFENMSYQIDGSHYGFAFGAVNRYGWVAASCLVP